VKIMLTTNEPIELWIEPASYRQNVTRRLHHRRDCCQPACVVSVMGFMRLSECSGPYAVQAGPPYVLWGDLCEKCLPAGNSVVEIRRLIEKHKPGLGMPTGNPDDISDGYHTFGELYEHRSVLFIALMNAYPGWSWFSLWHEDRSMFPGFFIAGMELPTGDITYHLRDTWLEWARRSGARELPTAPSYDGHSPDDVIKRLKNWINHG
jgi:hypothetical protein